MNAVKVLMNLAGFMKNSRLTEAQMKELQNRKLRELLRFAWNHSSFYRYTFTQLEESSASVTPEDETGEEAQEKQAPAKEELVARFGVDGEPFTMYLEDNSTAAAIAGYVGTSDWNLPVYSYDESDVMEYYDVPSRYEIPDNSETVTQAHAGEVFYSDPNRIVLYYHDAQINEEYTLIGTFDATDEFVDAVENNPVLEGWGNQIIVISVGE